MTIYRVEPDGNNELALWRAKDENDQSPVAIASLFSGGQAMSTGQTTVNMGHEDDHGVVFRAAAAVLAPDETLILAMAEAMFTEAGGHSWHAADLSVRDLWIGSAYAALRHLRAHVEEAS